MLEPREADIPALFLVLVVLPLVAYILLGKWSEGAKKRERVSLLAQLAAEEAFRTESRVNGSFIPLVPSSYNGHECARCFSPATTRCSRCKSVRYCSGKCQIMHWRQVHKKECHPLENTSSNTASRPILVEEFIHDSALLDGSMSSQFLRYNGNPIGMEKAPSDITYPFMSGVTSTSTACLEMDTSQVSIPDRRTKEKRVLRKSNKEMSRREDGTVFDSSADTSGIGMSDLISSNIILSKEAHTRHKPRKNSSAPSEEETSRRNSASSSGEHAHGRATSRSTMHESFKHQSLHGNTIEPKTNCGSSFNETDAHEIGMKFIPEGGNLLNGGLVLNDEAVEFNCSSEATSVKESVKGKNALNLPENKISRPPKSTIVESGDCLYSEIESKGPIVDETKAARARNSVHAGRRAASAGIMKMMGLRKPAKPVRHDLPEVNGDRHKKIKMLFPYEEFLRLFQCEIFELIPRGLMNCGNSCYANAVLQCLTCTKPLIIYLLRRSHSRSCCAKDWCLMCGLEQHAMMLREGGGPLSLSRILSNMQGKNCQIGNGSQEDAHEFLRLIVASMQSICLEGLGGEKKVDPRLQETTFIQHTFGGRLRSKVKCLSCHHESERYENIMDLTLEIYGWVESLEDALTQFTNPEDLDGENMYRCGRCAAYVQARKQLSIHEAPNILTIVLKRFQEGRYGKINKWITFPDMLDMIPFMTGMDDMPPLYMLYAVVVHLDTLNASFSGHYVSYVKDLQGNWFRIDDTEVQLVPMSQVMSEGAYILFYMRSSPRPQRAFASKTSRQQAPAKVSRPGQSKASGDVGPEPSQGKRQESTMDFSKHSSNGILRTTNRNILPAMERYAEPVSREFSDAASSDWSLFTSSDEASFTTESTRDSFSTVDYADTNDPISSIFNSIYAAPEYASHNTISCRMSSNSRPQSRFVSEEKGYVSNSYVSSQHVDRVHNLKQVSDFSTELPSDSNYDMFVRYGSNPKLSVDRNHCKL